MPWTSLRCSCRKHVDATHSLSEILQVELRLDTQWSESGKIYVVCFIVFTISGTFSRDVCCQGGTPTAAETQAIKTTGSAALKQRWWTIVANCKSGDPHFKSAWDETIVRLNTRQKSIDVRLIDASNSVIIDSFASDEVDVFDLERMPGADPEYVTDVCEALLHILVERTHQACNNAGFNAAHGAALTAEKILRCNRGYKTYVRDTPNARGDYDGKRIDKKKKRFCFDWIHKTDPSKNETKYYPIGNEGIAGGATITSHTSFSGNVDRYDLSLDSSFANIDKLRLPYCWGGGLVNIPSTSMNISIESYPLDGFADHLGVRVLGVTGEAPSFDVPSLGSTGINTVSFDTQANASLSPFGVWNLTTNQISVTYYGQITNQLFTQSNPLPFHAFINATWDGSLSSPIEFTTFARILHSSFDSPTPRIKPTSTDPRNPLSLTISAPNFEGLSYEIRVAQKLNYTSKAVVNPSFAVPLATDDLYNASIARDPNTWIDTVGQIGPDGLANATINIEVGHALFTKRLFVIVILSHPEGPAGGVAIASDPIEIQR